MRNLIVVIFILVSVILSSCSNQEDETIDTTLIHNPITATNPNPDNNSSLPQISFNEEFFDFGIIIQGERVSHTYRFTNTGNSNLIISNVNAGCGCTVPKFSKEPIPPGGQGEVEVIFDSAGRAGVQSKSVTVIANTQPNRIELRFISEIVVPK